MTTEQEVHDWDGCLMCAVRALTEGRAPEWALNNDRQPGDTVTGVVLRQGETPDAFQGRVPYVDLWIGGADRVRVSGRGMTLREALLASESQVGDTMTVKFEEIRKIESGAYKGKDFKLWTVEVKRGHH